MAGLGAFARGLTQGFGAATEATSRYQQNRREQEAWEADQEAAEFMRKALPEPGDAGAAQFSGSEDQLLQHVDSVGTAMGKPAGQAPRAMDWHATKEGLEQIYLRRGQFERGIVAVERLEKRMRDGFQQNALQARAALEAGNPALAGKYLERANVFLPNGLRIQTQVTPDGRLIGGAHNEMNDKFMGSQEITVEDIDRQLLTTLDLKSFLEEKRAGRRETREDKALRMQGEQFNQKHNLDVRTQDWREEAARLQYGLDKRQLEANLTDQAFWRGFKQEMFNYSMSQDEIVNSQRGRTLDDAEKRTRIMEKGQEVDLLLKRAQIGNMSWEREYQEKILKLKEEVQRAALTNDQITLAYKNQELNMAVHEMDAKIGYYDALAQYNRSKARGGLQMDAGDYNAWQDDLRTAVKDNGEGIVGRMPQELQDAIEKNPGAENALLGTVTMRANIIGGDFLRRGVPIDPSVAMELSTRLTAGSVRRDSTTNQLWIIDDNGRALAPVPGELQRSMPVALDEPGRIKEDGVLDVVGKRFQSGVARGAATAGPGTETPSRELPPNPAGAYDALSRYLPEVFNLEKGERALEGWGAAYGYGRRKIFGE